MKAGHGKLVVLISVNYVHFRGDLITVIQVFSPLEGNFNYIVNYLPLLKHFLIVPLEATD